MTASVRRPAGSPESAHPAAPALVEAADKLADAAQGRTDPLARRHLLTGAAYGKVGAGDVSGGVIDVLTLARELIAGGDPAGGVETFRLARRLAVEGQPPGAVDKIIAAADVKLTAEARFFQGYFSRGRPDAPVKIVVLADSLGLPRADAAVAGDESMAETYSAHILSALEAKYGAGQVALRAFCRRFMTSTSAAAWLDAEKRTLRDHLVLIHVGLNDCASRIFMERERHALTLLNKDARDAMIEFGRKYRVPIIHDDPEYNYVPLEEYRNRLEQCVKVARAFGAKQVFLTSTIQPPLNIEARTPHMRWNFGRYNQAAIDVAKRFSARMVDVDRLCWGGGTTETLNPDGMHLAPAGHLAIARDFVEQARPYLPAA